MSKTIMSAAVILLLLGAGCPASEPLEIPAAPPGPAEDGAPTGAPAGEPSGGASTGGTRAAATPYYVMYSADAVEKARAEGRAMVLYFWAGWCPICVADEPLIKRRIESSGLPIAGFRVDFDAEKSLREKYRVPYQHTTVMLGRDGVEAERFTGPVDEATFVGALQNVAK
jgi:thiol-disulfide isomerase/thioredoxin